MSSKKNLHSQKQSRSQLPFGNGDKDRQLEIVLKGDVSGTVEAIRSSISYIHVPGVEVRVIQSGVGAVTKSDLLMAQTASRLVIAFNVGVAPKLDRQIMESGVEIRLYDVIYKLSKDLTQICRQHIVREPEEKITGAAKVIATFKASKGIVIGCEVTQGALAQRSRFRVITAMGPTYFGRIDSLQIENKAAKRAKVGQQVGIQIKDWKKAQVGDLVESYEIIPTKREGWRPKPGVIKV